MKNKDIKNGSLYFNVNKSRVERVISNRFSNARVVTECHKNEEGSVQTKNLRLATSEEVEGYLAPPRTNLISRITEGALRGLRLM
jgi:hypothetical protein